MALRERFCFECTCERCTASGILADACLGAVSVAADVDGSAVRELEARLESTIATGAVRFLDQA